jgi:hypothetical protein
MAPAYPSIVDETYSTWGQIEFSTVSFSFHSNHGVAVDILLNYEAKEILTMLLNRFTDTFFTMKHTPSSA